MGKVQLRGVTATLDEDGRWICERGELDQLLREIAAKHPPRHYLPEPFAEQFTAIEALGATVLQRPEPLRDEGPPGTIY